MNFKCKHRNRKKNSIKEFYKKNLLLKLHCGCCYQIIPHTKKKGSCADLEYYGHYDYENSRWLK